MHLKQSPNCSEELPLAYLPRLKKEFRKFQKNRRRIANANYYREHKSKQQKTVASVEPTLPSHKQQKMASEKAVGPPLSSYKHMNINIKLI